MTTGSRIRALRESRGMTQRQLAERAGCTDAAIRNYEAGRRALKGSALDAIAGALGVAPEALMPVQAESARDALELLFRIEEEFGLRPVGGGRLAPRNTSPGRWGLADARRFEEDFKGSPYQRPSAENP